MVVETAETFWKLVSKDRFLKLKIFALKMHSMFANTYVCVRVRTFSTIKQVKSINRNRRQTKHWTIESPTGHH